MEEEDYKHPLLDKVRLTKRLFTAHILHETKVKGSMDVEGWQNRVKNARAVNGLFLPETIEQSEKKGQITLRIKYGPFLYLLQQEKLNRCKLQIPFTEEQLWFILYSLVDTSKQAEMKRVQLPSINTSNVLLDEYGNLRIVSQLYVLNSKIPQRKYPPRAPEHMAAGDNKKLLEGLRKSKCQGFQIGILMIELALLGNSQTIFKIKPYIDQKTLSQMLGKVRALYSNFFYSILQTMTQEDPKSRPSTHQVWAILQPYSKQIKQVESFKPNRTGSLHSLMTELQQIRPAK